MPLQPPGHRPHGGVSTALTPRKTQPDQQRCQAVKRAPRESLSLPAPPSLNVSLS